LIKKKYRYFPVAIIFALLLSGCETTRYLKENEKLLDRQKLIAPKGFNTEGLTNLYAQKPNGKFLGLPFNGLVWMYYKGERNYHQEKFIAKRDSVEQKFQRKINATNSSQKKANIEYRKQKKLETLNGKIEDGNLFMQWGDKVSVFDSSSVEKTLSRFKNYLFTKGYFLAKTSAQASGSRRKVTVTFTISPGPSYTYDSIIHDIVDSTVARYIEKAKKASLIKKGDSFDQDKLNKERERIDNMLRDKGFYDFSRQYIDFVVDTSFKSGHKIALRMEVKNPANHDFHKQFKVDSVTFTPDATTLNPTALKRKSNVYRGITYSYLIKQYSEKILSQRVSISADSLYNRSATFNTQRQLANLDVFKFVNINYDTSGGRFIANIFASPLDRYSWTNEAGVTVTQGFPGPYYTMSFRRRNIFHGLESFDINGRFGFEGVASATQSGNFYKSTEASVNGTITFPQFLFPMSQTTATRLGKFNPKTKVLGGYTYTDRPEYQRAINTVSATYTWDNKRTTQFTFTPISLNIIRSKTDSAFNALLTQLQSQGNNLIYSFKPSFVSSIIFSVIWNPHNYGNTQRSSFFLRSTFESGGTFFNLYKPNIVTRDGLETYRYLRASLDIRKNIVMNKTTILAYRFNSGVAYSYGENRALPYEKYFFAGGSNGVRAWRPRRLGIGSYPVQLSSNPTKDGLFDYSYEKPGEILLEGSVELRQKLFGFVSGAIFIDAGNVWTFKQYPPQTGANAATWTGNTQFRFNQFYKEFGIGTGFGLRFDFSFLILRLDVGMKAYDPAREMGQRFILNHVRFWGPYGTTKDPVIYNIGIGYPF
jgi:outer membrane protein insertion porin family